MRTKTIRGQPQTPSKLILQDEDVAWAEGEIRARLEFSLKLGYFSMSREAKRQELERVLVEVLSTLRV